MIEFEPLLRISQIHLPISHPNTKAYLYIFEGRYQEVTKRNFRT